MKMKMTNEIFDMALEIQPKVVEDSFEPLGFEKYLSSVRFNSKPEDSGYSLDVVHVPTDQEGITLITCEPSFSCQLVYRGYVRGDQIVCAKAVKEAQDLLASKMMIDQINTSNNSK